MVLSGPLAHQTTRPEIWSLLEQLVFTQYVCQLAVTNINIYEIMKGLKYYCYTPEGWNPLVLTAERGHRSVAELLVGSVGSSYVIDYMLNIN